MLKKEKDTNLNGLLSLEISKTAYGAIEIIMRKGAHNLSTNCYLFL